MTVARIWTSAGWMDLNGAPGLPGPQGPPGGPVPVGGTTDQVLAKASNTDGHVKWVDAGGGAAAVWIDEEAPSDPEANLWIDTNEPGVDLQDWAGLDTRVDTIELYRPTYVTSLPVSPYSGQEVYYRPVPDAGVWHLRYTQGWSDGYGWEFIGGAPLTAAATDGLVQTTSTNPVEVGQRVGITIPLAGDYMVNHGCGQMDNVGQAYAQARTALNTGALHGNVLSVYGAGGGGVAPGEMCTRINLPTAGVVLIQVYNASGSTARFVSRHLDMTPVRVK